MSTYINVSKSVFKEGRTNLKRSSSLYAAQGVLLGMFAVVPGLAMANPTDGVVVAGTATITNTASELQIHQSSNRAVIDWASFDIQAGETTRFYQPNSGSIALNRVVNSTQASVINGNLSANGRVIVMNPNGVLIGTTGNVDANAFIATSADIDNQAFMNSNGSLNFDRAGHQSAIVENRGHITVGEEGLAALVAPTVRNSGIIQGNLAKVQLAAADKFAVDFYGDGLIQFAVDAPTNGQLRTLTVENTGSLIADGGKVLMTAAQASNVVESVINTSGQIRAQGLVNHNGEIILTGGGAKINVAGTIDASGTANGGSIKIGGDLRGEGPLPNASEVTVNSNAVINADAGINGNGGSIIIWSDEYTKVYGSLSARGGSASGNGGFVETSTGDIMSLDGVYVNTLAANGNAGIWLLDPDNINIKPTGVPYTPLPGSGTVDVDVNTINAALSNVVLLANNGITVNANVNIAATGVGLSMIAGVAGSDIVGSYLNASNITIPVSLAAGTGTFNMAGNFIRTNGGAVTIITGDTITISNSTIYSRGGDVTFVSGDIGFNNSSSIYTRGGDIAMTAIDAAGTSGDIQTNSVKLDTTYFFNPTIGGITLIENGSQIPLGNYGNPQNVFVQTQNGGSIVISGKTIGGNSVCFAAGGPGCIVQDPLPPTYLTITADPKFKIYGSLDPLLTWNLTSGSLLSGDSFIGALIRAAGENVGLYPILQGTLTATGVGNYIITYIGSNLTIDPYILTVAADPQSKIYGQLDPTLTWQLTGGTLQNGDTASVFTGGLNRNAGENVGAYAINQGTLSAGGNYIISYTGANLTIDPATLTIIANAQNKIYGSVDPALTYSASGFQFSDNAGSVLTGGLTRNPGENVGSYAILQGTLAANSNYIINYTGADLTISPYVLSVVADAKNKIYGSADPSLTYTYGTLQNGDTASVFTGGLNRNAGENVGAYAINQGTLSAGGNYIISYTGANLTIDPATLTIIANAQNKIYGSVDPALTYSASGFQFSDNAGSVLTGGLTRNPGENVGSYAILQGTLAANSNYIINYTGADLTISPYVLSVVADAKNKIYGSADPSLTYTYGTLQNGDTASVFTGGLNRNAGENVGAYAINQGTLSAGGNYIISYTGANLTIDPATLTIIANAQNKIYGSVDPALTYSASGFQFSDNAGSVLTGGLTRNPGENVGSYAILQGTLAANSNYIINYTGADLTISPYVLSVVADAKNKIYGSADPSLTYTYGTLQNGDTASVFTGGLNRNAGENVGAYAINQGTLSAGGNYIISYTGANLTIDPATLTIIANAQNKIYGSVDPALTYSASGFQFSDNAGSVLTGGLTRNPGENVGSYAILQGTLAANSNYIINYTGADLTISPYILTVAADPQSKIEGQSDPALTYTYGALQNGDNASVFTGGLIRDPGETPGNYNINQGSLFAGNNYVINYIGNLLVITSRQQTSPQPIVVIPFIEIDPLNRPIISVANQAIIQDLPFEPYEILTMDTNVSISTDFAPRFNVSDLGNLSPAAGGKYYNPKDLGNLSPSAGGAASQGANTDITCGNNFLDNKPCVNL